MNPLRLLLLAGFAAGFATLAAQTPPAISAPRLFAVTFTTGPAWDAAKPPAEQAHFREHSANLARLRREGLLLLGARYADKGFIVLRAESEEAVRAQLAQDPSVAAGVFNAQIDAFNPFYHGSTAYLATPEAVALRAYLDAFNRHDAEAVAAFCAEDFKWYSIDGDKIAADAENRAQLRDWLVSYFKSLPSVRSEFLSIEQSGLYLTVRERASWQNAEGQRVAQQGFGVYEIRDGLIRRVWYYPSTREPVR